MKFKNRRGSTLGLTIIVFGVLMILGTFVLSFMVTENKQAMYHQNKTQAYYLARSGADIVEDALIAQLSTYSNDADDQKNFLNVYDIGQTIEVNILGVKNVTVVNETINDNRLLTVKSTAEYRGIDQTVKKVIYSTVTEISSNEGGITISNAPLMYVENATQHTNQGVNAIPPEFAHKVVGDAFKPHDFLYITEGLWETENDIVNEWKISGGTIGNTGVTTNIYVDGPLTLEGTINFKGTVNIFVREHLEIKDSTKVISESLINNGVKEYLLNIYVYNEKSNEYGLITPVKIAITFMGNLYIKEGKVNLDLHQDAFIEGNIIYNGVDFRIGTQSNNLKDLKKLFEGSIYAPNSDIFIGFQNDKTAFVLDGMILGKNIAVSAKNSTQVNKFYDAFKTSGLIKIPVNTGSNITTRAVGYLSYYSD